MKYIDITTFKRTQITSLSIQNGAHHKIQIGKCDGDDRLWYRKEMGNHTEAQIELVAQEFFRLIVPHQPVTLLAKNTHLGTSYILSEAVPGFKYMPDNPKDFLVGTHTGLGKAVVLAMYLEEIDLKRGNIGLDDRNRVIKIDGDWCFAEIRNEYQPYCSHEITPETLKNLPMPKNLPVYNWLDYTVMGKIHKSSFFTQELIDNAQLQLEMNQTILAICLIPDSFIYHFVDTYIDHGAQRFIDILIRRREKLKYSALQLPSFINYLNTLEAKTIINDTFTRLTSFSVLDTPFISKDEYKQLQIDIDNIKLPANMFDACNDLLDSLSTLSAELDQYIDMCRQHILINKDNLTELMSINNELLQTRTFHCKRIINECNVLMQKISCPARDLILTSTLNECHNTLRKNKNTPQQLNAVKDKLSLILAIMKSPQAKAIEETIRSFHSRIGFFTVGMQHKANTIEEAFYTTPLNKRLTILSSATNKVHEALAMHRHWGRRGNVYKTPDRRIDRQWAATSFKELTRLFDMEASASYNKGSKIL